MHICFIVENSLTMLQKTSNSELSIFDQVKHSVETVVKNIFRNWNSYSGQQPNDVIHLFVTSSTEPISSYVDNNQMHLIHQIRNIQCTIPTFPAQAIESALYQIGKFKCLNQTQTFLGYRQGTVYQPALVFYITDNSNTRKIQKINQKILQNKFHLRAEHKFITIKYCAPSPNQVNLSNLDKFKNFVETQKQTLMMEEIMRKINGQLLFVFSSEQLVNCIQNLMYKNSPTLTMGLSNKEYKIHNKEIVKLQFPTAAGEEKYMQRLKSLRQQCSLTKNSQKSSIDLFIDSIPLASRTKIPLPHEMTPKHLNENRIIIDEFEPLRYYIDFSKEYVGSLCPSMRFLLNVYELGENKQLLGLMQDFGQQKRFPLFYERKKIQYLIGYMRLHFKQPQNPSSRTIQLHFSFSNFTNLNANIRSYLQRNPSSQQYFQNYISTLPIFYHKFLKYYLPSLNIVLSPQTEQCFQNIHAKPIGVTNMKFYEQRLAEKNQVIKQRDDSFNQHRQRVSLCCSVYSETFEEWEIQRSKFYYIKNISSAQKNTQLTKFFNESIQKLTSLQPHTFIYNYLTPQQVHSSSTKCQLQKYGNIRRNDEQMDELVGGLFGNPFRKINKKVKLYDEAESVWVEPEEVGTMKELLNKEMEVFYQMYSQLSQGQIAQMDKILKMDSIYDKLAGVKGIIADALTNLQRLEKKNHVNDTNAPKNISNLTQRPYQQPPKDNLNHQKNENLIFEQKDQHQENEKMIEQFQSSIEASSELMNQEQQILLYSWKEQNQGKQQDSRNKNGQKYQTYKKDQQMLEQTSQRTPDIIEQVNSKFTMVKSTVLQIPCHLIHNDLYARNKSIIAQTLLGYLGLSQISK